MNPANNPLAEAEVYMSIDAAPGGNAPAGNVNTGMIGMRDGPVVSYIGQLGDRMQAVRISVYVVSLVSICCKVLQR